MRMVFRRLAPLAAACTLVLASASLAEVPADGPRRSEAALAAFQERMKTPAGAPRLPRLADPADAGILTEIWDAAVPGREPYRAADIPLLLAIMEKQAFVLKAYVLFSSDPGRQPDTERNAAAYQDEISRSYAFMVRLNAAAFQAIADFLPNLPAEQKTASRLQGLRMTRTGLLQMVSGAALMLRSPALSAPNQQVIATSLAENAAGLAVAMIPADRAALTAVLQAARPSVTPSVQQAINAFVATMSSAPCGALCRID